MRFEVGRVIDPLFDPNASWVRVIYHADGVAPHTLTQRISIAPSAGQMYVVRVLYAQLMRSTAPTTAGVATAYIAYSPDGVNEVYIAVATILSSTLGMLDRSLGQLELPLRYPGYVRGYTSDASTGGTCDYRLGVLYQVW
jgi:hypothetical protein